MYYSAQLKMKKINIFLFAALCFIAVNSFSQIGNSVETFPDNVGGKDEFKRVFEQELSFPEKALKEKLERKAVLNFTVKKDSTISDIKVTASGSAEIDEEAVRLLKLYQWIPAVKDGHYITSAWSVTFNFDPKKYDKICRERRFIKFRFIPGTKVDSSEIVYKTPDLMPAYQKGDYALQDFIKENLEYPRQAQLSNIQGKVVLRFVIEPSGLPTNICVDKHVGGGCDEEAIRVLQLIKWYPGKKENKFVRVQMTYPFYFILNDEFRDNSGGEQK